MRISLERSAGRGRRRERSRTAFSWEELILLSADFSLCRTDDTLRHNAWLAFENMNFRDIHEESRLASSLLAKRRRILWPFGKGLLLWTDHRGRGSLVKLWLTAIARPYLSLKRYVSITYRKQLTAMPMDCMLASLQRQSGRNRSLILISPLDFTPLPVIQQPRTPEAFALVHHTWLSSSVYLCTDIAGGCPTCVQ